jgi:quinoprotein glucose dehydrogenase
MAMDEKRGIVYVPTASPKYNFYGGNRKGSNLFGDSLLALNARTGKLLWHFQMVHHDIWDYDNPNTPMLATVRHNGKMVDIVAQTSKTGYLWVFNRVNGKPLWPVEERPVPKSPMPGEVTWPTQPVPTKPEPFGRQTFTSKDLSPYLEPAERAQLVKQIDAARNDGLFTPPSTEDTVEMPGNNGGANWGGTAIDPVHGYLYVVSKDLPAMLKLTLPPATPRGDTPEARGAAVYANTCSLCHGMNREGKAPVIPTLVDIHGRLSETQLRDTVRYGKGMMPAFGSLPTAQVDDLMKYLKNPGLPAPQTASAAVTPVDPTTARYRSGFGFMFAESGLPVIAPPWTTLTSYDLNTGNVRWKIPLGDVPELAEKGITGTGSHFPKTAPVATAGGLIFTGTRDRKVRALDASTGKVLWEEEVGAALEGMPAIYQVAGKQYVVFCAAARSTTRTHAVPGHPASQDPIHGAYVAFALP